VSFRVGPGEVAALLGPNGSGKTTVMRMLTGFFAPTTGRAVIGELDVSEHPLEARREIGYLPEQVSLYPELTVRRFLGFVAGVRGLAGSAGRRAVDVALERCVLGAVADRLTGKLSKGFRQRVGLAQAILGDPRVLVLDEPTVGLDPLQTIEFRRVIRGLSRCTVLLSTHLLAEASALCSRVLVLRAGRLLADDSAEALAQRMAGERTVVVRAEGDPAIVARVLAAIDGVSAVRAMVDDEGPGLRFDVRARDTVAAQRAIAPALLGAGCGVLEIAPRMPTLEDLFVRLVEPAGGPG
jgi:ABC-2 type transport system ATP-binding protein